MISAQGSQSWKKSRDGINVLGSYWILNEPARAEEIPDQDDDRGSLGHGSDQAANTHHTQEDEEGLLAAWHRTFPRNRCG